MLKGLNGFNVQKYWKVVKTSLKHILLKGVNGFWQIHGFKLGCLAIDKSFIETPRAYEKSSFQS